MSQLQAADLTSGREAPSVEVRLRDGALATLRPLHRGETGPLLAVCDGMSDAARALRYLAGMSRLPGPMLSTLPDVDGDRHAAWLASLGGEPAGIARYVRLAGDRATAEVAFEVVDHHHGRGLATMLLDAITTAAATRGVRRVQGTMAPSNKASRRLLERVGASARLVDGLLEADGPLSLLDPPVLDRSAVVRLACSGAWDEDLDIG